MLFTLSIWRRRDDLWEHIEGTTELDIVDTDKLDYFTLSIPRGTAHPYFYGLGLPKGRRGKDECIQNIVKEG